MDSTDNSNEVQSSGLVDDQPGPAPNAFRILSVAEINCTQKRKLPTWMTNNNEGSARKSKRIETKKSLNKENEVLNEASSAIDENVGSSHQEDDLNDCPSSPPSIPNQNMLEVVIEENKVDSQLDDVAQNGNCDDGASSSNELGGDSAARNEDPVNGTVAVKEEQEDSRNSEPSSSTATVANPNNTPVKKQIKVEKNEATSTTQRDCCQYGIRCYRRNPAHRVEMAHPGDPDYRLPDYPTPPLGTPSCPYGIKCYRRNPVHFQDFSHPPSTDPEKNWKRRLRQLKKKRIADKNKNSQDVATSNGEEDDYDYEDPFIDDGSLSEYSPSESEIDDESD